MCSLLWVFNSSGSLIFGNIGKFSSVVDLLPFCDKVLSVRLNTLKKRVKLNAISTNFNKYISF